MSDNVYLAISSSGVCGSSVKTCRREYAVSWCVFKSTCLCVCEGDATHGGGTVQVNTSCQSVRFSLRPRPPFARGRGGDKPDPPHPPTHTHRTRTRNSPRSLLPSSFKEFTLRQYILLALLGLPPRFRLGLCTTALCTR